MDITKLIIVPETKENENIPVHRIGYTYLHGNLQYDCGTDLFGFKSTEEKYFCSDDETIFSSDTYPCTYNDKKCTFFFWRCSMNRPHGLVVYNDDRISYNDAKNKYNKKSITI